MAASGGGGSRRVVRTVRAGSSRAPESRGATETVVLGPAAARREGPARARLVDLAADWLSLVLAVRQAAAIPDAAALRARALELKQRLEDDARRESIAAPDVDAATFALVGFLDESVLKGTGPGRDAWISRPLQLELYGAMVAGEEFFDRLERMRREREARIEGLEVYAACLAFGFAGKHAFGGPERLRGMLNELESDLTAVRGSGRGPLAPHARRPDEAGGAALGAGIPWWLAAAVGFGGVILTWLVLKLIQSLGAAGDAAAIRKLLGA